MSPQTSRDFLKAAAQRLIVAEALLDIGYTLDAQYIGGYTVECSLKALLMEKTESASRPEKLKTITAGAKWHDPEILSHLSRKPADSILYSLEIPKDSF